MPQVGGGGSFGERSTGCSFNIRIAFLHRAFELWILSGNHVFGPILNINVGRNTFILTAHLPSREKNPPRGAIILLPSMNGSVSVGPMPIP